MEVITQNKEQTVGIISKVDTLKCVGEFEVKYLKEWIKQVEMVLGEETVVIHFRKSDNQQEIAYLICASHGDDPRVGVVGMTKDGGGEWE